MVATLQKKNKLLMLPDGDRLRFEGGIPKLTGEMGAELADEYLDEIGRATLLRKLEEQSFDAQDIGHVADFLVKHGIQPSTDNAFRLVFGARLHMLFAERFGEE